MTKSANIEQRERRRSEKEPAKKEERMESKNAQCETCLRKSPVTESVAVFLCFACEMFVCECCKVDHRSHDGIHVESEVRDETGGKSVSKKSSRKTGLWGILKKSKEKKEQTREDRERTGEKSGRKKLKKKSRRLEKTSQGHEDESDRQKGIEEKEEKENKVEKRRIAEKLWNDVMNESKIAREERFKSNNMIICDRVEVKHKLDKENYCSVSGFCKLENKRWVACDPSNSCIKIFKAGSHDLQRYIRMVGSMCEPWDVTEIRLKQKSDESSSEFNKVLYISGSNRTEVFEKCLAVVTLPWLCKILFLDLSKVPATIDKVIHTEESCYSVQCYEDKIFTVCRQVLGSPWSLYSKSTNGCTLTKFNTGFHVYTHVPYLAVVSGQVFLTDYNSNKVQCRNFEGNDISEITIEGSGPRGISVDSDNNVYVCAQRHNKVYKLDANLIRYESVLDQTTDYVDEPRAVLYYRDNLFISHFGSPSLRNCVTVVRLL